MYETNLNKLLRRKWFLHPSRYISLFVHAFVKQ